MTISYGKLRGRIVEIYGKQCEFARKMGWSNRTMSLKINGKVSWRQEEILHAVELLNLQDTDIVDYFFDIKVKSA